MKRALGYCLLVLVTVVLSVGGAVAFAGDTPGPPKPDPTIARIDNDVVLPLPDGSTVQCIVVYDRPGPKGRASGIWCKP